MREGARVSACVRACLRACVSVCVRVAVQVFELCCYERECCCAPTRLCEHNCAEWGMGDLVDAIFTSGLCVPWWFLESI